MSGKTDGNPLLAQAGIESCHHFRATVVDRLGMGIDMANEGINIEMLQNLYDEVVLSGPIPDVAGTWVRDEDGIYHLYRPDGTWVGCMSDSALERLKKVLEGKES